MRQYSTSMPNGGYILIVILMFLQVATLLSLYAIQALWLENKLSHDHLQRMIIYMQVEHLASIIEQQLQETNSICIVQTMSSEELRTKPITWWENESCAGIFQSIQYYYVVEPLGEDPCAHIRQTKESTANYYRLTLLGLDKDSGDKLLLQSTFVKENPSAHSCEGAVHQIDAGQQSLRTLF